MKFIATSLKLLPLFTLLFIIMIGNSWQIGGFPLMPALLLMPVYYWLVYHPSWLPLEGLFVIGLLYDSLMGHDLGLTSFFLMLSALLGPSIRSYLRPDKFPLIWFGFGLFSGGYLLLYGLITSSGFVMFVSWISGIILYPLAAWILSHLHGWIQKYV
ncbi:MAG: rod shape-determining protein MreD [Alphaproteobacteria bacterium]|nr:rod shape-determining protein MreD [Alphaproteobacteria bacterium]